MRPKLDHELIYQTALPFFARYGYKKTTLEDIAGALGMSNTNLYSYAKSKRDLYDGCVSYAIDQWQEYVRQCCKGIDDPLDKLKETFRSAVTYLATHEDTQALLRNDPAIFPMFPSIDPIEEYNDWSVNWATDIVKEGVEQGIFRAENVAEVGEMLFNFYKFFIISTLESTQDEETLATRMKVFTDLAFYGLVTDEARQRSED